MNKEQALHYAVTGRELEFYKGDKLFASLTYFQKDGHRWVSFCYAYQDTVDYPLEDFDKLWVSPYHNKTVGEIIESFPEEDIVIY
ncbi:MAG: hypothetical protein PUA93_07775 [Eubacteriales bacterium]|nr:hypothetical protein [Eubacteriales bacterium]